MKTSTWLPLTICFAKAKDPAECVGATGIPVAPVNPSRSVWTSAVYASALNVIMGASETEEVVGVVSEGALVRLLVLPAEVLLVWVPGERATMPRATIIATAAIAPAATVRETPRLLTRPPL